MFLYIINEVLNIKVSPRIVTSRGNFLPLNVCSDPSLSLGPQWKWSCKAVYVAGRPPPETVGLFVLMSTWTVNKQNKVKFVILKAPVFN